MAFRGIDTLYDGMEEILRLIWFHSILLTDHHKGLTEEEKRESHKILYIGYDQDPIETKSTEIIKRLEIVLNLKRNKT